MVLEEQENKQEKLEALLNELKTGIRTPDNKWRITISTEKKMPAMEERYNIHPGHAYRIKFRGMNPNCYLVCDGILKNITADFDEKGLTIRHVELEDGLESTEWYGRTPFDKISIDVDASLDGFGIIIDEEGFKRVRDKIKAEQNEKSQQH